MFLRTINVCQLQSYSGIPTKNKTKKPPQRTKEINNFKQELDRHEENKQFQQMKEKKESL